MPPVPPDSAPGPHGTTPPGPGRRALLGAAAAGVFAALAGLPAFRAAAEPVPRPAGDPLVPDASALRLRYDAPAAPDRMIREGLPVGNGRLGALVGGDPARDLLFVTDGTMWTGGLNDTLDADGQFPYGRTDFGSLTQLAHLELALPGHTADSVTGYRRTLDLSNGLVTCAYRKGDDAYRREVYASHPDDVLVVHLRRTAGTGADGLLTGTVTLSGTHGEQVGTAREATESHPAQDATASRAGHDATVSRAARGATASPTVSFGATLENGLRYGVALTAVSDEGGSVWVAPSGDAVAFRDCTSLTLVLSGGTDYAPDAAHGYRDPSLRPRELAENKVRTAARHAPAVLLATHVADHRRLFDTMEVSLGDSSAAQRALDTPARLAARAAEGAQPDPELEAAYLQFGRYLTICGSRDSVPMGLQGLWLDGNDPDWMGDYHTDINIQMSYWLADRAGLPSCFDALTDYCLAQLPSWSDVTRRTFNDPRNRFRNSTGKVAGWAVAFSTNIHGGSGWWWHPAANAWLCNSLYQHYEYTRDRRDLARIQPLLRGACEFWEARLVSTVVDGREVLVDDKDWSPEHGPQDGIGNTYAQELVWDLFGHYVTACDVLGRDTAHAQRIAGLRERLYLPKVSPTTGWLEEWMSPDNLGETEHRHLSPLFGLFPGDRIRVGDAPEELLAGVRNLLTARGMNSYGWANAWRALCWARLGEAETAYRLIATNLRPSVDDSNGTAANLFDIYQVEEDRSIFQIDANLGTPTAMLEMLVRSRPGHLELLPALPAAWAEQGRVTGIGVRGGVTVDVAWRDGRVREATLHAAGGRPVRLAVTANGRTRTVHLSPGRPLTL